MIRFGMKFGRPGRTLMGRKTSSFLLGRTSFLMPYGKLLVDREVRGVVRSSISKDALP